MQEKPIKIAIDAREITSNVTGIGRILRNFLAYAGTDDSIECILIGNQKTTLSHHEFSHFKKLIIREHITSLWDQAILPCAVRSSGADIFFSPYCKMPLLLNKPAIISIFDITYLLVEPYRSQPHYSLYVKNFIKLSARKAKKILTCSNATKKDLVNHLGIDERKIEVVYLPIEKYFSPQPEHKIEQVKKKYGITGKYILYVGNSKPHKNLNRLILAYSILPEKIQKEYRLILAGAGGSFPVDPKINCAVIPYATDGDLAPLYSGADIFVFPSLYEGYGLPPIEAMACGCPVVSSSTASLPEVLSDSAIYFNPADINDMAAKIETAIKYPNLRRELKNKGLDRSKIFTSDNANQKLAELFKKLTKV